MNGKNKVKSKLCDGGPRLNKEKVKQNVPDI